MSTRTDTTSGSAISSEVYREYTNEEVQAFLEEIDQQGYVVLPSCVDPEVLARADARAQAALDEEGSSSKEQPRGTPRVLANLMGKGSEFWELITQPNVLTFVTSILGYDCLLSSASYRGVSPGCEAQGLHTDDVLYGRDWFERPIMRQLSLVATVALVPFTETNGSTLVFPGSHRWHEEPGELPGIRDVKGVESYNQIVRDWAREHKDTEPVQVVMDPGSMAVWYGATWHCGGAYTAEDGDERGSILLNLCRGILRPQETQLALLELNEIAKMPLALQRLLGFTMSSTGLGYADKADPALLLGEGGKALLEENQKLSRRRNA